MSLSEFNWSRAVHNIAMAMLIGLAAWIGSTMVDVKVLLATGISERGHMSVDISENGSRLDRHDVTLGEFAVGQSDLKARVVILERVP